MKRASATFCTSSGVVKRRRPCLLLTFQLGSQTVCKHLEADHDDLSRRFRLKRQRIGRYAERRERESRVRKERRWIEEREEKRDRRDRGENREKSGEGDR